MSKADAVIVDNSLDSLNSMMMIFLWCDDEDEEDVERRIHICLTFLSDFYIFTQLRLFFHFSLSLRVEQIRQKEILKKFVKKFKEKRHKNIDKIKIFKIFSLFQM